MKRTITLCLALSLIMSLLAGCSIPAASAKTAGDVQVVHNVDELIAAIAPGANIQLAEGTYDLAHAVSYGQRTGNPYVKWAECWDGYFLSIHDVDNLTITGGGKDNTQIISNCPDADVLKLEDCTGVVLEGFTAGHTPQSDGCAAGVISVFRTADTRLSALGLFGCGSVGISADRAENLVVEQCEIYDCSISGMQISRSRSVTVKQTSLHNIGKMSDGYNTGYALLTVSQSSDVQIRGCEMADSVLQIMLSAYDSDRLLLTGNCIAGNSAAQGMFWLMNADTVIESSNIFEGNTFSHWYVQSWDGTAVAYAVDEAQNPVFMEDPEPIHTSTDPVEAAPVIAGEQKRVEAATVDELLAAIDSNTEIVLTAPMYDLSTASNYGNPGQDLHYTWDEVYDGWELVIMGVENFSIVGDEDEVNHTISATPRYANVITFRNCGGVLVRGFTAGHTTEPGYCAGGVLNAEYCSNIAADKCNLYGCGILGVAAYQVENLQITNCCIYECSTGGILCTETNCVTIGGCTFWDLGGDIFKLSGCTDVTIDGKDVNGNYYGN